MVDCQVDSLANYPVSGTIYLNHTLLCSMDLVCLLFFTFVQVRKLQRFNLDRSGKVRNVCFFVIIVICIATTIYRLVTVETTIVTGLLRPVIVCLFYRQLRSAASLIFFNLKDSALTLLIIFIFVLYSAFVAEFLFYSTFEGISVFDSFQDSLWEATVLMTTENFPDVMLLAYQKSLFSSFFFILFIVVGIFYLLSILLSIVFDNYKQRIEQIGKRKQDLRLTYIKVFYDSFDEEGLGYLNYKQARDFFS